MEPISIEDLAKDIIVDHFNETAASSADEITRAEVRIVWFSKNLQNWKGCFITTRNPEDQLYYEVTSNGDKEEIYIDTYKKISNVVIPWG